MSGIFSKIIAGEIPSHKVYEDENHYAFLDVNPNALGHTLCVPKKEVDKIFDLSDTLTKALLILLILCFNFMLFKFFSKCISIEAENISCFTLVTFCKIHNIE